jgi:CRP-like cAMP-binding protein
MSERPTLPDEKIFKHSFYKTGSIVFNQGDTGTDIFILKKGAVTVFVDGKIVGLINTPNTFIGEMAFVLKIPRTATIEAVEDSEFVVIPAEYLYDNVIKNPELGFELIKILSGRLANTTKYATRLEREVGEMRGTIRKLQGVEEEESKRTIEEEMVHYGLITEEDLEIVRNEHRKQRELGNHTSLINIMIKKGMLRLDEIIEFLEMKQAS